jgi:two-component system cell cycle sensor histidine kinase/response regulator CckA
MVGQRAGDESRPRGAPEGATEGAPGGGAPPRGDTAADALRGGLDPEALFGGVTFLDEKQTLQWLGHLQRLASTGLLAGGMAHDLAGLLQPLLFESERALLDDDASGHREALVRMRELARRSEDYVRALLTLVRRDEHHRAAVPVESVVEDTLGLLASMKRLVGVSVTRNLDNRHVALVDRTRLMQAVLNLVTNAVRAAQQGGREVTIGVRGWRGWVLVEVEDNGPGVPPEIAGRVFQPFVQATSGSPAERPGGSEQDTTSPRGMRTGLGLYITRRLVEEQGGRIEFETEPGVGTVFRLMLEPAPVEGAIIRPGEPDVPRRGGPPPGN